VTALRASDRFAHKIELAAWRFVSREILSREGVCLSSGCFPVLRPPCLAPAVGPFLDNQGDHDEDLDEFTQVMGIAQSMQHIRVLQIRTVGIEAWSVYEKTRS